MKTVITPLLMMVLMAALAACGQDEAVTGPAATESAAMEDADHMAQEMADAMAAEAAAGLSEEPVEDEFAVVFFITPEDGAEVTSPVLVQFGLQGMDVAPAGTETPNTGHHHLLIDVDELPAMDQPIPSDEQHRHFGKGQTEVSLELSPGVHTLQLLLGDGSHVPHDPAILSAPLTITVVEE